MNTPGFTAKSSLYVTDEKYRQLKADTADSAVRPQYTLDCGGPVACINNVWYCACACQSFPGGPPYLCYQPCGSCVS
jgi:hypothetical protein